MPNAPVSLWRRLIAGGDTRRTRLHDEGGRRVPGSRLIRNGPRALATGLGRLALGIRPVRPWISYDAQRVLAAFLTPQRTVLEFGSGMSTAWYARRAGRVVAIEDDPHWFARVADSLRGAGNVAVLQAGDRASYARTAPDERFDLIVIDGSWRCDCAALAIARLKPGGMIYLDNADMGPGLPTGDVPRARAILLDFARANGLRSREFTDFAPTQLFVQRGLLIGG